MKYEVAHKKIAQQEMHILIKLETINKYTTEHGTNYHQRHSKQFSTAGKDTESTYRLHADNI